MSTFKSYKSDAWEDPTINKRYEADAWTDCEFAKRYISDAWEEIWTSMRVMTVASSTLTNGQIEISDNKRSFSFERYEDKEQAYGSLSGGGYIEFRIDVEPKSVLNVQLDWVGGLNYCNNTYSTFFQGSMGTIHVGYINSTGSSAILGAITVGGQELDSSGWCLSYGEFDQSVTAGSSPITQVYIRLYPEDKSGSLFWNGGMECEIYNVVINGEEVGFSPDTEAYSKFISDYE